MLLLSRATQRSMLGPIPENVSRCDNEVFYRICKTDSSIRAAPTTSLRVRSEGRMAMGKVLCALRHFCAVIVTRIKNTHTIEQAARGDFEMGELSGPGKRFSALRGSASKWSKFVHKIQSWYIFAMLILPKFREFLFQNKFCVSDINRFTY